MYICIYGEENGMLSLLERQTDRQKGRSKIPAELDLWAGHVISGREKLPLGLGALTLLLCGSSHVAPPRGVWICVCGCGGVGVGVCRSGRRGRDWESFEKKHVQKAGLLGLLWEALPSPQLCAQESSEEWSIRTFMHSAHISVATWDWSMNTSQLTLFWLQGSGSPFPKTWRYSCSPSKVKTKMSESESALVVMGPAPNMELSDIWKSCRIWDYNKLVKTYPLQMGPVCTQNPWTEPPCACPVPSQQSGMLGTQGEPCKYFMPVQQQMLPHEPRVTCAASDRNSTWNGWGQRGNWLSHRIQKKIRWLKWGKAGSSWTPEQPEPKLDQNILCPSLTLPLSAQGFIFRPQYGTKPRGRVLLAFTIQELTLWRKPGDSFLVPSWKIPGRDSDRPSMGAMPMPEKLSPLKTWQQPQESSGGSKENRNFQKMENVYKKRTVPSTGSTP